jgi:hypothetical protein
LCEDRNLPEGMNSSPFVDCIRSDPSSGSVLIAINIVVIPHGPLNLAVDNVLIRKPDLAHILWNLLLEMDSTDRLYVYENAFKVDETPISGRARA